MSLINDLKVGDTAYVCDFEAPNIFPHNGDITRLTNCKPCKVTVHKFDDFANGTIAVVDDNGLEYSASYHGKFHYLYTLNAGKFISRIPLTNLVMQRAYGCYQDNRFNLEFFPKLIKCH